MLLTILILSADFLLLGWLLIRQQHINSILIMNSAEALQALQDIKKQNAKVFTEVSGKLTELTGKIASLEDRLANGALPEEIASAIAEIKTGLQATDDLIPDVTPAPETPAE